jgi:hypothetical protein
VRGAIGRHVVVAVQVVTLHQPDQLRAVLGIGGIDAGERGRKGVGMGAAGHGLPVVGAGCEQLAVVVDALADVVVDAERAVHRDPLPVLEFLGGHHIAARGAAAFDAEQIVILAGQCALAPAGLVDRLSDGHRRRNAEPALGRDRPPRDLIDERLLGRGVIGRSREVRRQMPYIWVVRLRR